MENGCNFMIFFLEGGGGLGDIIKRGQFKFVLTGAHGGVASKI